MTQAPKTRFALVGTGHRGATFFARNFLRDHGDECEFVAFLDSNRRRAELANELLGTSIPIFLDFDQMIRETDPDCILVTSKDSTHREYIVRSLEAGKSPITEKPMVINAEQVREVLEAERRTGVDVRVAFNYRYMPYATAMKQILADGRIGRIFHVQLEWMLDRRHGADYFRRWHRNKENSGGLLVHKATHHFDMVQWCLEEDPIQVYATGARRFYGPTREERGERCSTCDHADSCDFYFDQTALSNGSLYTQAEGEDGYFRDRCVFDPDIDIEDTVAVAVTYSGGARLNYSLCAYSPFEGYRFIFTGEKGRLQAGLVEGGTKERRFLRVWNSKEPETIPVEITPGTHAGADPIMLDHMLHPDRDDPLGRAAGARAGALSVLTGVAANESIRTGMPVRITDLVPSDLLTPSLTPT